MRDRLSAHRAALRLRHHVEAVVAHYADLPNAGISPFPRDDLTTRLLTGLLSLGYTLAQDSKHGILIGGSTSGTAKFGSAELQSLGGTDLYVAKLKAE